MYKLGHIIRRVFLSAFSIILLAAPVANAEVLLPAGRSAEWAENGIVFYNPNSCGTDSYTPCSGGSDNFEKIVCYFSGSNPFGIQLPATGIAGIIANAEAESGLDPFKNEYDNGPGYGIFQFTPRAKIIAPLQSDPRSAPYFNEWYTASAQVGGNAPVEVNDAFLFVELDFAVQSEFNTTTLGAYRHMGGEMGLDYLSDGLTILQGMQQAQSASDAARVFVWIYERPSDKPGGAATRSARAEEILPRVEALIGSGSSSGIPNTASYGGGGTATADNGSSITMIGDSLTVGASNLINSTVPGIDIDASVGRHFSEGINILQSKASGGSLRDIVVFALGTNDANGVTSSMAQQVVDIAGPDRQVIFVTNYTERADYTSNNNVFRQMANTNSNVVVADFASIAASKSNLFVDDGIHHSAEGQEVFTEIIFSGVTTGVAGNSRAQNNCPGTSDSLAPGNGNINATAITLSWPEFGHDPWNDPKPEYRAALASTGVNRLGDRCSMNGNSCDAFVATVLRYSGADKNAVCCGTGNMLDYFRSHPEIYQEIPNASISNLQGGDIRIIGGHIELFVTLPDGQPRIASASHCDRTADHAGNYYTDSTKPTYVFRVKGGGSNVY